MRVWILWLSGCSSFLIPGLASPVAAAPSALTVFSGLYDVAHGGEGSTAGAEMIFTRRRFRGLPKFVPGLAPVGGVLVATEDSVYVYGGLLLDLPLGERWVVTPSVAAGLLHSGPVHRFGGPVEFRSSLDLAYRFSDVARFGLRFSHLSNGGLYRRNPGVESLTFILSAGFGAPRR